MASGGRDSDTSVGSLASDCPGISACDGATGVSASDCGSISDVCSASDGTASVRRRQQLDSVVLCVSAFEDEVKDRFRGLRAELDRLLQEDEGRRIEHNTALRRLQRELDHARQDRDGLSARSQSLEDDSSRLEAELRTAAREHQEQLSHVARQHRASCVARRAACRWRRRTFGRREENNNQAVRRLEAVNAALRAELDLMQESARSALLQSAHSLNTHAVIFQDAANRRLDEPRRGVDDTSGRRRVLEDREQQHRQRQQQQQEAQQQQQQLREQERRRLHQVEQERLQQQEEERERQERLQQQEERDRLEQQRLRQQEEERLRQQEEERLQQQEDRLRQQEQERLRQQEQERLRQQEQERLRQQEQERLRQQEQERLRQQEQERLRQQEQERLRQQEQERLRQQEQERLRQQEQEQLQQQEAERLRKEEERLQQQERLRQEQERQRQQEQERQRQQEQERQRQQEQERLRQQEQEQLQQQEAERLRQEQERQRQQEQERQQQQEQERLQQQELEHDRRKQEQERLVQHEQQRYNIYPPTGTHGNLRESRNQDLPQNPEPSHIRPNEHRYRLQPPLHRFPLTVPMQRGQQQRTTVPPPRGSPGHLSRPSLPLSDYNPSALRDESRARLLQLTQRGRPRLSALERPLDSRGGRTPGVFDAASGAMGRGAASSTPQSADCSKAQHIHICHCLTASSGEASKENRPEIECTQCDPVANSNFSHRPITGRSVGSYRGIRGMRTRGGGRGRSYPDESDECRHDRRKVEVFTPKSSTVVIERHRVVP